MDKTFSPDDVHGFLKTIIETGNAHYIDDENCIRNRNDETPVGVKINNGKDSAKKIALYKENMPINPDCVILSPFVEELGRHPERDWFFSYVTVLPGCLIKEAIREMASIATSSEKDTDFKAAAALSKFIDRIDKKFVDEVDKLRQLDLAFIYYGKDCHVAQLNSSIWKDEWEDKMKGKLRKSSIMLIRDMVSTMLDTSKPEEIMYKATLIGCPQFDAVIHVFVDVLRRMNDTFTKIFPEIDLHVPELQEHLNHIEAYHKALKWLATSSTSPAKEKDKGVTTVSDMKEAPWTAVSVGPKPPQLGAGGLDAVKAVTPAGTVSNPCFPGATPGTVTNPSFGTGAFGAMAMTPVGLSIGASCGVRPVLPTFRMPQLTMPTMPMMTPGFGGMPGCYM